jgi:tetratricopeptide (TPR) repeat protein
MASAAFSDYAKAVAASPRLIDSRFFIDLGKRHPEADTLVVGQAVRILAANESSSPLIKARLGKLHAHQQRRAEALREIEDSLEQMPNLPEAWVNLGNTYTDTGRSDIATLCYRRALFLDSVNVVARARLADHLYEEGHQQASLQNYRAALSRPLVSGHAKLCNRLYRLPTVADDLLPAGLLRYCEPAIPYESCQRFRLLCKLRGVDLTHSEDVECK